MKKYLLSFMVLLAVFVLAGCKSEETATESTTESTIKITNMTAEEIVNTFKDAGFPIDNIIVYDEDTDVNGLLGRPNQYISKVNFADTRVEQWGDDENPVGGSVEVFENASDAESRYEYINEISSSTSLFVQYLYLYKNVLLRIDGDLTPTQASEYEEAFKSLQNGEMPTFNGDNSETTTELTDSATQDDCTVQILDCEITTDYDGNDAVAISFQFTNDGSNAICFNDEFYVTAYQSGVEQSSNGMTFGDDYDWNTADTGVKDGASITVYTELPLDSTTDSLEVVIMSIMGDEIASKTFELQ